MLTPQHIKKLAPLGITVPEQLLLYLPSSYTDHRSFLTQFPVQLPDGWVLLRVTAIDSPTIPRGCVPPRLSFRVSDGARVATVKVFGIIQPWKGVANGDELFLRGKLKYWNGDLQIEQADRIFAGQVGRVVPNYKGKKGATSGDWVYKMTQAAVLPYAEATARYVRSLFDGLSDSEIFSRAQITEFPSILDFLLALHRPATPDVGERAIECARRIAAAHLIHEGQKQRHKKPVPASYIPVDTKQMLRLIAELPFELTSHQRMAIHDIVGDLGSPYPMFRLLSGDVNTGKTVSFGLAAALVHLAGRQAAILTPNILLARQITTNLRAMFKRIPVLCIEGNSKGAADLSNKPIVVGTTALFSRLSETPDLLVIDEQQKLSREQRAKLTGRATNVVEATATCIPRTAALASHGGMDYSILNQSPVIRRVISRVVESTHEHRTRLRDHVQKVVAAGGQVAVIYPVVTAREGEEKRSVEGSAEWWEKHFPGRTATLHGKMSDAEKQGVIDGLMEHRFDVIVTTVILEVGLTLPSLKALITVDADRFGLSQLHQLRGRVARAGGTGYFFAVLSSNCDDDARSRLKLMEETSDGYALAERDLDLRGFGDLSVDADSQHGKGASGIFVGLKLPYQTLRDLAPRA